MATLPEVKTDAGYGPEPQLAVAQPLLHAEPGAAVQTQVTVRHGGDRVEGFHLDVVGLPPGWWRVEPPLLELLPGTSGTAVVELRPPAGTPAPDAPLPFGVRATSALDPGRGVVEEGDLEVGRQLSLTAEISPRTARARWRGRYVVTFTNWGNAAVDLALSAREPDGRLGFLIAPDAVTVPVGGTASARVKARIRRPVLRGRPAPAPFQVVAGGPDAGARLPAAPGAPAMVPPPAGPVRAAAARTQTLDAVVEPRAVLSNGVIVALGLVALLLIALVAWLLRLPAVMGATVPRATPGAPARVRITDFTGQRATLAWAPDGNALHRVVAYAGAVDRAEAVGSAAATSYASTVAVTLKEAKAKSRYCFEVVAFDGAAETHGTPVCATTKAPGLAAPKVQQPQLDQGTGTAVVTWDGDPSTTYEVQSTTGDGAPDGTNRSVVVGRSLARMPVVPGVNCFVVRAVRGGQQSPYSQPPACLPVPPQGAATGGGPGVTPSGGASGGPSGVGPSGGVTPTGPADGRPLLTGYLVAVFEQPVTDGVTTSEQRATAEALKAALRKAGYGGADYQLLEAPKYPAFPVPTFVDYALVTANRATADATCRDIKALQSRKGGPLSGYTGCDVVPLAPPAPAAAP